MFYLQCIDLWLFWKYNLPPQPTPWRCGTPFLQNIWHLHLFLAADHLTIEWGGGYGWFQIKILRKLIWREKLLQGNTWEKKFLHWKYVSLMVYYAGKKLLHRFYLSPQIWETFFQRNHPYHHQKSNGWLLRGRWQRGRQYFKLFSKFLQNKF